RFSRDWSSDVCSSDLAKSALDTGRALRRLISADFALARSATGRAMAWVAIGVVFGASAWLLLMGALIVLLQRIDGISWLASFTRSEERRVGEEERARG